ncbi:MAG: methyltransferase, partial [Rhizobacter sp.]
MTLRPLLHLLSIACLAVAALPALAAPDLATVIDGPQRSAANRARDPARHPLETLTFFGLAPNQTVVEIAP